MLIIAIAMLLPLISFTPRQLWNAWKQYWFRPAPLVYLALFRIITVGTQLILMLLEKGYGLQKFARLAALPDSMYKPLPILHLFLLPFGLSARPSFAVLTLIYWRTAVAGMGWLLRSEIATQSLSFCCREYISSRLLNTLSETYTIAKR